ncbi:DUF4123 domain-containing protein [Duganella radicis]|uniref:DUF4123 domain-containing protein n=1 Tax=Duganella radicis TaxID=551988 RepID=A0A6L6PLM7_9BURK|nr:DUF4123 domain-containing protein [Duganella radicis]MTV40020.1 DUF4123 domain-containing protein [Duganella radicis]
MNQINLQKLAEQMPLDDAENIYALVDGAQCSKSFIEFERDYGISAAVSLLTGTVEHDAKYAGPLLQSFKPGMLRYQLGRLVELPDAALYVSVIRSRLLVDEIIQRLSALTEVLHDDGSRWVMRYYDPRVLPHWLSVLTEEQRAEALAGIAQWSYVDCRGELQTLHHEGGYLPAPSRPVELSAAQVDRLMDACLPYTMTDLLLSDHVEELRAIPDFERYDFFLRQLTRAKEHGVTGMADLKTYCFLATLLGPEFDGLPLLRTVLQSPHGLSNAVLDWGAAEWQSLEV